MSEDSVTIELQDPLGWLYVIKRPDDQWSWNAMRGFFHFDSGVEPSKDEALNRAREAFEDVTASTNAD